MNTSGYGGRFLKKSATVITNDPKASKIELTMEGEVESFVNVIPTYIRLYGHIGEKVSEKVLIVPSEKYPFNILSAKAQHGENIKFELMPDTRSDKNGYILTIENVLKQKGRYYDLVHLKTDSQFKPFLTVKVYGNILEKPDERSKTQEGKND